MQSFKEFIDEIRELSEEELQEKASAAFGEPLHISGSKPDKSQSKKAHKNIEKLWKKFLDDINKAGYVIPRGHVNDQLSFHKRDFSPKDFSGRITLRLPKNVARFVQRTK